MKPRLEIARHCAKVIALAAVLVLAVPLAASAHGGRAFGFPGYGHVDGMVYAMSNAASGNRVVAFERMHDGSLRPQYAYRTGGRGTGAGLGTQGALALSPSGHWLIAVNAGSNSISTFLVFDHYLLRTNVTSSHGQTPNSVAISHGTVYVLNAGSDSLQGFRMNTFGTLSPIAHSSRALGDTGTGAAQVGFNRAGDLLAVTEKATGKVLTYAVDGDGLLGPATTTASPGPTPFGFAFGRRDQLLVSEAGPQGGSVPGTSTVSSYQLDGSGGTRVVSGAVPNGQTAACWLVVTRGGHYAYITNTQSDDVSIYRVAITGRLRLVNGAAAATGHTPIDLALDRDDQHLYTLNAGNGTISAFSVQANGSLQLIENQSVPGLSSAASGLVAR